MVFYVSSLFWISCLIWRAQKKFFCTTWIIFVYFIKILKKIALKFPKLILSLGILLFCINQLLRALCSWKCRSLVPFSNLRFCLSNVWNHYYQFLNFLIASQSCFFCFLRIYFVKHSQIVFLMYVYVFMHQGNDWDFHQWKCSDVQRA